MTLKKLAKNWTHGPEKLTGAFPDLLTETQNEIDHLAQQG